MFSTLIQAVYTNLRCVLNLQFQQLVLYSEISGNACEKLDGKIISRVLFLFESFQQTRLADIATNHCNFEYHFNDIKLSLFLKCRLSHLRLSLDFVPFVFSNSNSLISENLFEDVRRNGRRRRVDYLEFYYFFDFFLCFL